MENDNKILAISILVSAIILAIGFYLTTLTLKSKAVETKKIELINTIKEIPDVKKTDKVVDFKYDADLFIVSYLDPECIACKNFYNLEKKLIKKYKSEKNIAFVYREFPLYRTVSGKEGIHPSSGMESVALECAYKIGGNKKYFEYLEKIFENTNSDGHFPESILLQITRELNINETKFSECLDSDEMKKWLEDNWKLNYEIGLRATPTVYLVIKSTGQKVKLDPNVNMIDSAISLYLDKFSQK